LRYAKVKAIPLPVSFLLVLAMTIALMIFFGAWAVSADVAERERVFAFAVPGATSTLISDARATGPLALGESRTAEANHAADTWWGNGLLRACPLH
jgi:hypothetical protein